MKKKKKQIKKRLQKKQRKLQQQAVVFQEKGEQREHSNTAKTSPTRSAPRPWQDEMNWRLLLIPLILLVTLGIVSLFTSKTTRELEAYQFKNSTTASPDPYAFLKTSIQPPITAEAAIIMDSDSKVILYQKNPQDRFAMASTTKLMTSLVALDYFSPHDILTVTTPDVGGQTLHFPMGEQLYFQDILYAMLLPSSNHAASVVAHNYPGGYDAFIAKMNEKARELSLNDTHYVDPAGLNDNGNYTTVVDLARLAAEVEKNKTLAQITSTKYKTITNVSGTTVYPLSNLNILLGQDGVTGLKTGYTEGAGGVLVTTVVKSGRTFIVVVMRSMDRFADTKVLLSYLGKDVTFFTPQFGVRENL